MAMLYEDFMAENEVKSGEEIEKILMEQYNWTTKEFKEYRDKVQEMVELAQRYPEIHQKEKKYE